MSPINVRSWGRVFAVLFLLGCVVEVADAQGGGRGGRGGAGRGAAPRGGNNGGPRNPGRDGGDDASEGENGPPKTPGGTEVGSLETVRKLDVTWRYLRLKPTVDPKAAADPQAPAKDPLQATFDQSATPAEARNPRPAVVWFCAAESDPVLEQRLFGSDEFRVAAQFFDCVKIVHADIEPAAVRAKYGKTAPTFVFLDAGAKETGRVSSPDGPKTLLAQMFKAAAPHFKKPLNETVTKYLDWLKRFDKTAVKFAAAAKELAAAEAKDLEAPSDRNKADVKRLQGELNKLKLERERQNDEERALLKLELKVDPYAKPEAKPDPKAAAGAAKG